MREEEIKMRHWSPGNVSFLEGKIPIEEDHRDVEMKTSLGFVLIEWLPAGNDRLLVLVFKKISNKH